VALTIGKDGVLAQGGNNSGPGVREAGVREESRVLPQHTVCADVGASYVRVAVAHGGRVTRLTERLIADLLAQYSGDIVLAIGELIASVRTLEADGEAAYSPIGVGVPAIVDENGGLRVGLVSGIPDGTGLRDRLSERFATEVVVDNDSSLAALGESLFGAGQGERNLVLLTLGTNIGMGIVAGGQIYRGARGGAGEIGTVPVRLDRSETLRWDVVKAGRPDHSEPTPPDGYVWLEELYGGQALAEIWKALTAKTTADGSSPAPKVLQLAAAGDPVAAKLVPEALAGWALSIATASTILDPGAVLIGGGIAADIGPHLGRLREAVGHLMPGRAPRVEIAALGPLAGLIGAAAAARMASSLTGAH
jgi:glucokinase